MSTSNTAWLANSPYVLIGEDYGQPVDVDRIYDDRRARGCVAYDMRGFDRRYPRFLMRWFFEADCARMAVGVPLPFLSFAYRCTCFSRLEFSDDGRILKFRGNPSGFPNTLWLNTVGLAVVINFSFMRCVMATKPLGVKPIGATSRREWTDTLVFDDTFGGTDPHHSQLPLGETIHGWPTSHEAYGGANFIMAYSKMLAWHFRVELCGDDTRVWALTDYAVHVLDFRHKCDARLERFDNRGLMDV